MLRFTDKCRKDTLTERNNDMIKCAICRPTYLEHIIAEYNVIFEIIEKPFFNLLQKLHKLRTLLLYRFMLNELE